MKISLINLFAVLLLAGCASVQPPSHSDSVPFAPKANMVFPPLHDLKNTGESAQLITATYQDQKVTFQNQISASPEKLLIVFFDPFGRNALTIDWDKDNISYKKADFFPSNLNPENILMDFVIMNWPTQSLKKALAASGAKVIDHPKHRQIMLDGALLLDVTYDVPLRKQTGKNHIVYHHLLWDYTLHIQSIKQSSGGAQ